MVLTTSIKSKPAPLYHASFVNRITTGNLDDENSNLVQDLILQIANEHDIALILSTHDTNFANKMNTIYKISNRNIKEV